MTNTYVRHLNRFIGDGLYEVMGFNGFGEEDFPWFLAVVIAFAVLWGVFYAIRKIMRITRRVK